MDVMTHKLHSITIGVFTYVEGQIGIKPLGGGNTVDVKVEQLEVDHAYSMAGVWFADGDMISTHLASALLRYKPITTEPKGDDNEGHNSDEPDDGQAAGVEMGGREGGGDTDRGEGDSQERQVDEGRAPDDGREGQSTE